MLEINKIYNKCCLDGMHDLDLESCDIAVTSPPYKEKDGYSEFLMVYTFIYLYSILKENSLFFLNFGHLAEDKFRPFKVCNLAMRQGFKLNDTITWVKKQYSPIQGNKRLNNVTEFIFLLYKGKMPIIDRLSIGVPYKDKSNIGRYADKDLKCGGNCWEIGYETIQSKSQKLHPDRFPEKLVENCVKLSGLKSGVLVDPFMGSGTSAVVAKRLGLNYIGFEKNVDYYNVAVNRLKV